MKMEHVLKVLAILSTLYVPSTCADVQFMIREEEPAGFLVGNLDNLDNLGYSNINNDLRFKLLNTLDKGVTYFQIGDVDGNLKTRCIIDRETVCEFMKSCELTLSIAIKSTIATFFKVVNVAVYIDDINDNAPTFGQQDISLNIPENVLIGTTVMLTEVFDKDTGSQNSIKSFELVPSTKGEHLPFALLPRMPIDGHIHVEIVVTEQLDRELVDFYQFYIIAQDGGSPPRSGSVAVNVTVLDTNDCSPIFSYATYNVTILDTVETNTPILTVLTTDCDVGKNGDVRYSLSPNQLKDNFKYFSIDAVTGVLTVIQNLTAGSDSYWLVVIASDQGEVTRITTQSIVHVTVLHTGNHPPQVSINLLSSNQGYARISEYANIGSVVAVISVVDEDNGPNGKVSCSILGDLSRYFGLLRLVIDKYKVVLISPLDYEAENVYRVAIQCKDKGVPPKTTEAEFVVHVADENDNAPVFTQYTYVVDVNENNNISDKIITVSATDADSGNNARLTYRLLTTKYASIDPVTGVVTANTVPDKEGSEGRGFSLRVLAIDHGNPPLTSTATIIVHVNDVVHESSNSEIVG